MITINIEKTRSNKNDLSNIFLINNIDEIKEEFSKEELAYIKSKIKAEESIITFQNLNLSNTVVLEKKNKKAYITSENWRKSGSEIFNLLQNDKSKEVNIVSYLKKKKTIEFTEGLMLSDYKFDKYLSKKNPSELKKINLVSTVNKETVEELNAVVYATKVARNWVNEPLSYLTAEKFSEEIKKECENEGCKVEIFDKKKIETLKMGGLIAVNKGAVNPPTFTIVEWKPKNAQNKKPIVFVGKGVVYDTGGLSLKPTANSMDEMKCDMGGAAAAAGGILAIAKAKLPYHVIAIIPATENRPGGDAYAPGDVIKMYNGKTVEVLNTDAEGRMILADALSYADSFNPELVLDLATLTGSAVMSLGHEASVIVGNAEEADKIKLINAGFNTFERVVEFPFWEEYGEKVKSEIADLKNLGGPYAGAITAGKFLENFTKAPWIHIDIAGPAYLPAKDAYRPKFGTGVGVRLLFNFISNY